MGTKNVQGENQETPGKGSIESKWGKRLSQHWTAIPMEFLERYTELGLNVGQAMLLIQISRFWWEEARLPFPGLRWIAKSMGVSYSQARRYVKECVDLKCLDFQFRPGKTHIFDLTPLRESLEALPRKQKRNMTPSWLAPDKPKGIASPYSPTISSKRNPKIR